MINKSIIFISLFIVFGCDDITKRNDIPNKKLANEFGINSTELIYQYYQKFGFTDLCEDIRMVSIPKEVPKLYKNLPISIDDRNIINNFSNKTDSIRKSSITFKTNTRNQFYDIELDFIEFTTDSALIINLNKGKYQISQTKSTSILKIYDNESGSYYMEIHRCDY